jgi:N-methylhydantoinase A
MSYRVAMDIGGTFTDFVMIDEDAQVTSTGKTSTTPANPEQGVLEGIGQLVPELGDISFIVHGTTVGLNAFLERKGTRVLLVMTAGMRDAYSIARHDRKELYTLRYRKPERLVPRRDVYEVTERLRFDGSVDTPLDEASLAPVIAAVKDHGIEAVAVCLLHAYVNPEHELQVRSMLERACPGLSVTLSHEIAREWREYERASTAALNAYVAPRVESYLRNLGDELTTREVKATLHVMQSNGGITTAAKARRQPVQTLLSGPVGGTIGGAALSRAIDRPNLLCIDMGGTSFDLSLIIDGRPTVSTETDLEGLPILMPLVDIHTIGAGGGSLAWLEAGGLRVGPQSAGAMPGPACYGRGGTQPTVTDANLFLGRLDPDFFLGGRMRLDDEAAARAVHRVADQIGLDDTALAEGMLAIVNANMADAMRTITVKQGIDPRDFSLVAFGGAGPMHAAWLAQELEIRDRAVEPGDVLGVGDVADGHPPRRGPQLLPDGRRARGRLRPRCAGRAAGGGRRAARVRGHPRRRPLLRPLGGHAIRRAGVHGARPGRAGRWARRARRLVPRCASRPVRPLHTGSSRRVRQPPDRGLREDRRRCGAVPGAQ